jgi:cation diffusion facilitator CzcD-associated flavoprotein CzcO
MTSEHVDVVVVGAGLSGIGAGYHLQTMSPDRSYVILEGRESLGGTWDLFKYPGVRSDSDMHTLGFSFKPWTEAKSIADGPSILQYLKQTVSQFGIDKHIRYGQLVTKAQWSTDDAQWTVTSTNKSTGATNI